MQHHRELRKCQQPRLKPAVGLPRMRTLPAGPGPPHALLFAPMRTRSHHQPGTAPKRPETAIDFEENRL